MENLVETGELTTEMEWKMVTLIDGGSVCGHDEVMVVAGAVVFVVLVGLFIKRGIEDCLLFLIRSTPYEGQHEKERGGQM